MLHMALRTVSRSEMIIPMPLPEKSQNPKSWEISKWESEKPMINYQYHVNYFLMNYRNQLVLTGEINDDGALYQKKCREKLPYGIELSGGYKPITIVGSCRKSKSERK